MTSKLQTRSVMGYTIYAIIGTIVELSLLMVIVFWLLPLFGVNLVPWLTGMLVAALLGISYFTYHMGRRALRKRAMFDLESMVGAEGTVVASFERTGYVRIGNELWKAAAPEPVETGDIVIVKEVNGFKIKVAPKSVAGRRRTQGQPGDF